SSAGPEHLPYKEGVIGSNPIAPTGTTCPSAPNGTGGHFRTQTCARSICRTRAPRRTFGESVFHPARRVVAMPGEIMRPATPLLALLVAACAAGPQPSVAPGPAPAADVRLPALPQAAPVSAREYAARRATLLDSLSDGVLVIFGAPSPAADYLPFAQLADFRYLTGIMEPAAAYIAVKRGGSVQEHLFVLDRDPARE